MSKNITIKLKKVGDKLIHVDPKTELLYQNYRASLPEGTVVEMYTQIVTENASLGQIAKIHAMIRDLSLFTGNTFNEMKTEVKQKAGLILKSPGNIVVKSFSVASSEELMSCIQAAIEIGALVGYQLN